MHAIGLHWWDELQGIQALQRWKGSYEFALAQLCEGWRLPKATSKKSRPLSVPVAQGTDLTVADAEPDEVALVGSHSSGLLKKGEVVLLNADVCETPNHAFRVIVDNQSVASIANGSHVLKDPRFVPVFERVVGRFDQWLEQGSEKIGPGPVQWRPRHLNAYTDALANEAMARIRTFVRTYGSWKREDLLQMSLFGVSDGGMRSSSESCVASFGWVVAAWNKHLDFCLFSKNQVLC